MEIEPLMKKMIDIYSPLIDFIEADDDNDSKIKNLIQNLEKHEIFENKEVLIFLFQLLSKIADNHHRTLDFFDKLEKIYRYLIKDTPSPISYFIPNYTTYNKRVLFLLLGKKLLKPDETFLKKYLQSKPINYPISIENYFEYQSYYYIYPVIKEFLDEKKQKEIEEEIHKLFDIEDISTFYKKCEIGENDSYICSLIRSDSIEEFISYVNRTNLSLSTKITPSIYETNSFLIDKEPTLIEYAAFYGSIQIIQYLKNYNIALKFALWYYAVHSNNGELIQFLEENEVKPKTSCYDRNSYSARRYGKALMESIKCHHNEISNYIIDNFYEPIPKKYQYQFCDIFNEAISNSLNFFFYPKEIKYVISGLRNEKGFNFCQLLSSLPSLTFPLTEITIPSSVTSIGDYAFSGCSSLTQISIPSSIKSIGDYAFSGCSSLTQIAIPTSIKSIGDYAFSGCSSLPQIAIPSSVAVIGNSAFEGCSSLVIISISKKLKIIKKRCFKDCYSLEQIYFPSSLKSIQSGAFDGCDSLQFVSVPEYIDLKDSGIDEDYVEIDRF